MGPEQNYGYQVPNYSMQPDSPKQKIRKIIFILAGAFIGLSILAFIFVLIFAGPSSRNDVSKIQGNYIEIARITELADESDAGMRVTQNAAASLAMVSLTNQAAIAAYADDTYRSGLNPTLILESKNTQIDAELADAALDNTYDETFAEIMSGLLQDTNTKIANVATSYPDETELVQLMNQLFEGNEVVINSLN